MSMIENYLVKNSDFEYLFNMFNEAPSHIHDPKTMIYFLDEKKYGVNINDIKSYQEKIKLPVLNKLRDEIRDSYYKLCQENKKNLKKKKVQCNPCWPTCLYDNYNHIVVEYVITKESKPPFIINDYYYIKNQGTELKDEIIEEIGFASEKEVLIERQKHVCDDMKLVNMSQNLIENETNRNNYLFDDKANENTLIYGHLGQLKELDKLIQEIRNDLVLKDKEIDLKDIYNIIEKNSQGEKYYNREYSFYVLE